MWKLHAELHCKSRCLSVVMAKRDEPASYSCCSTGFHIQSACFHCLLAKHKCPRRCCLQEWLAPFCILSTVQKEEIEQCPVSISSCLHLMAQCSLMRLCQRVACFCRQLKGRSNEKKSETLDSYSNDCTMPSSPQHGTLLAHHLLGTSRALQLFQGLWTSSCRKQTSGTVVPKHKMCQC